MIIHLICFSSLNIVVRKWNWPRLHIYIYIYIYIYSNTAAAFQNNFHMRHYMSRMAHTRHIVSCVTYCVMRDIFHTRQIVHARHCFMGQMCSYATCLHAWHTSYATRSSWSTLCHGPNVFIRHVFMRDMISYVTSTWNLKFPANNSLYKLTSKISIFTLTSFISFTIFIFFLPTIIISSLKVMANLHLHIF